MRRVGIDAAMIQAMQVPSRVVNVKLSLDVELND